MLEGMHEQVDHLAPHRHSDLSITEKAFSEDRFAEENFLALRRGLKRLQIPDGCASSFDDVVTKAPPAEIRRSALDHALAEVNLNTLPVGGSKHQRAAGLMFVQPLHFIEERIRDEIAH